MGTGEREWVRELRQRRRGRNNVPLTERQVEARMLAQHLEEEHGKYIRVIPEDTGQLFRMHRAAHRPRHEQTHTHNPEYRRIEP